MVHIKKVADKRGASRLRGSQSHRFVVEFNRRRLGILEQIYGRASPRLNSRHGSGDLITIDQEILGGTPVFKGTRVPIKILFEYLENDYSLEEFLECILW